MLYKYEFYLAHICIDYIKTWYFDIGKLICIHRKVQIYIPLVLKWQLYKSRSPILWGSKSYSWNYSHIKFWNQARFGKIPSLCCKEAIHYSTLFPLCVMYCSFLKQGQTSVNICISCFWKTKTDKNRQTSAIQTSCNQDKKFSFKSMMF